MTEKKASKPKASKKTESKKKSPAKKPAAIKEGYFVRVEYTGTFEDGTVFDCTDEQGEPMEFQIGAGQVIEGFEKAIAAMKVGEEKSITLQPEEAYGEYKDNMKQDIPRDRMPLDDIKVGTTLMATLPTGMQIPVTIAGLTAETVTIDLNHPLAGKVLNFKLKLVDVREGELKECDSGCCTPDCHCH